MSKRTEEIVIQIVFGFAIGVFLNFLCWLFFPDFMASNPEFFQAAVYVMVTVLGMGYFLWELVRAIRNDGR